MESAQPEGQEPQTGPVQQRRKEEGKLPDMFVPWSISVSRQRGYRASDLAFKVLPETVLPAYMHHERSLQLFVDL